MRELRRVLKPSGWAIIQVPITAPQTFEDPSITDPRDRERIFGQTDHVRVYGPDYRDRLAMAGFSVKVDDFESLERVRPAVHIRPRESRLKLSPLKPAMS
jgi:hypothetical protein